VVGRKRNRKGIDISLNKSDSYYHSDHCPLSFPHHGLATAARINIKAEELVWVKDTDVQGLLDNELRLKLKACVLCNAALCYS